ncbi:hypothetical protein CYMTET_33814, partial [Cymbomonas tetramitiformis]
MAELPSSPADSTSRKGKKNLSTFVKKVAGGSSGSPSESKRVKSIAAAAQKSLVAKERLLELLEDAQTHSRYFYGFSKPELETLIRVFSIEEFQVGDKIVIIDEKPDRILLMLNGVASVRYR